jgi:hypothetical protein
MAGELSHLNRNRSSTIPEVDYVMDQIDVSDLPPTSWVRNDWYSIPRVPSGEIPLDHPGLYALHLLPQVLHPIFALSRATAGLRAEIYAVTCSAGLGAGHDAATCSAGSNAGPLCVEVITNRKKLITEKRSEDPLVVMINTVVVNDGLLLTSAGDANEWARRYIAGICVVRCLLGGCASI